MSYESEQIKFNAELDFLKVQVEKLDMYFSKNPNAKIRRYNYYGISTETFRPVRLNTPYQLAIR